MSSHLTACPCPPQVDLCSSQDQAVVHRFHARAAGQVLGRPGPEGQPGGGRWRQADGTPGARQAMKRQWKVKEKQCKGRDKAVRSQLLISSWQVLAVLAMLAMLGVLGVLGMFVLLLAHLLIARSSLNRLAGPIADQRVACCCFLVPPAWAVGAPAQAAAVRGRLHLLRRARGPATLHSAGDQGDLGGERATAVFLCLSLRLHGCFLCLSFAGKCFCPRRARR